MPVKHVIMHALQLALACLNHTAALNIMCVSLQSYGIQHTGHDEAHNMSTCCGTACFWRAEPGRQAGRFHFAGRHDSVSTASADAPTFCSVTSSGLNQGSLPSGFSLCRATTHEGLGYMLV